MLALSTRDTLEACAARWERAQQVVEEKPARKRTRKEEDDG
jgi:hypothetical protein